MKNPTRALCPAIVIVLAVFACSCGQPSNSKLIDRLQHSDRFETRVAAARILGERKAVDAVQPLIHSLNRDIPPVRVSAARALRRIKDPRAVEPLIQLLNDPNYLVQAEAARGLGEMKDAKAVEPLISALKRRNAEAGPALAGIGNAAIAPLVRCLRDSDLRLGASDILEKIGTPAVDALCDAVQTNSGAAKVAAAKVLAEIDDPRVAQTLDPIVSDSDLWLAAAAYKFLLRKNTPAGNDLLLKVLETYGNMRMAKDFINSPRPGLRLAAENWANQNNYSIDMLTSLAAAESRSRSTAR